MSKQDSNSIPELVELLVRIEGGNEGSSFTTATAQCSGWTPSITMRWKDEKGAGWVKRSRNPSPSQTVIDGFRKNSTHPTGCSPGRVVGAQGFCSDDHRNLSNHFAWSVTSSIRHETCRRSMIIFCSSSRLIDFVSRKLISTRAG